MKLSKIAIAISLGTTGFLGNIDLVDSTYFKIDMGISSALADCRPTDSGVECDPIPGGDGWNWWDTGWDDWHDPGFVNRDGADGGDSGPANNGGESPPPTTESPEQCRLRVNTEFALCESNAYNRFSVITRHDCARGGLWEAIVNSCDRIAKAEKEAELANCRLEKARGVQKCD